MVKKGKRQGFLVVVLIMSLLFFIIAVAICSFLGVQYSIMGESEQSLRALYAADSGVQYTMALMGICSFVPSSEKYFGYAYNDYDSGNSNTYPRAFDRATLYQLYAPVTNWNTVNPIPLEVSGQSAKYYYDLNPYADNDFAWKMLWDDGISTAVYFTVVRALYFPNDQPMATATPPSVNLIPGTAFNPNQAGSYNEQVSGNKLEGTGSEDATTLNPPGCPFDEYKETLDGGGNTDGCQETSEKATKQHYHCRYTIKSIGEVWSYSGPSTSKTMGRVLARRTVMAEIITREPIDKRGNGSLIMDAKLWRWYEVFR